MSSTVRLDSTPTHPHTPTQVALRAADGGLPAVTHGVAPLGCVLGDLVVEFIFVLGGLQHRSRQSTKRHQWHQWTPSSGVSHGPRGSQSLRVLGRSPVQ